jgi:hypothetical protein
MVFKPDVFERIESKCHFMLARHHAEFARSRLSDWLRDDLQPPDWPRSRTLRQTRLRIENHNLHHDA